MATILDLFKEKKSDIYGKTGKIFIDSRGLINPPRGAALLLSSPNSVADLIGNQVSGVLKGSADRPSDTIFKNNKVFSKPISLGKTQRGLKDAIEKDTPYFVKQSPAPESILSSITQGGSNIGGVAMNAAIQGIQKFGSKNGIKDLKNILKNKQIQENSFGSKFNIGADGKPIKDNVLYSTHYRNDEGKIVPRTNTKVLKGDSPFQSINNKILQHLETDNDISDEKIKTFKTDNSNLQIPFVLFELYGKKDKNILLPGTVTGISEDNTPEWTNFKYMGSPFYVYRYTGVESKIGFELKLYWEDEKSYKTLKKNLDKLRRLVFPDEDVVRINYNNPDNYSPLAFTGNFLYMTINGLYERLFGFIDSLQISIEDSTSWANYDFDKKQDGSNVTPFPTVINLTMSFTVIHKHKLDNGKYNYDFTGIPIK